MVKAKCAKCGAEVELNDNYANFVEKYPERVTCFKCKNSGGKSATKATKKAVEQAKTECACHCGETSAERFKEVYYQFKEVFGDELKDVKDYIGGWVSTVIIQGTKKNK